MFADIRRAIAGALLAVGSLASNLLAEETPQDDFFGELPVVLSAARIAQTTTDSPVSFSVLDQEAIRAIGARDIAELFRLLPGFQVGYFVGNRPVVTYHGLADQYARRMQVLIDGRSVYVPAYGGVPWETLPLALEDIVRIEVIRGPNAASYGPNSFLGVISITTRHASEDEGFYAGVAGGDREYRRGVLRQNGHSSDLDYRVTVGYEEHDGFDAVHDDKLARLLTTRIDYSFNALDTLMLQAGVNRDRQQTGIEGRIGEPPRESTNTYHFYHARWERNLSAEQALVMQYYFNEYDVSDDFAIDTVIDVPPPVPASTFVDFDLRSRRHDLELQYNFVPARGWRVVTGGSVRQDTLEGRGFLGRDDELINNVARVFAHGEWSATPDFYVNAGAMVEDNDITGTEISPKLGLLYRIRPDQSLRAGVSHATRTPLFLEESADSFVVIDLGPPAPPGTQQINYQLFSEGGLEPEQITSYELGYRLSRPRLAFDLRLFYDEVDKLIVQEEIDPFAADTFDGDVFTFVNRASARIAGIEASLDSELGARSRLIASASYAETEADDDNDSEDIERSVPPWTVGLLGIHRLRDGAFVSFDYNYIQDMDWVDKDEVFTTRKLDLQYLRHIGLAGQRATFAINLENITGDYTEYQSENVVESGAYVSFAVNFR